MFHVIRNSSVAQINLREVQGDGAFFSLHGLRPGTSDGVKIVGQLLRDLHTLLVLAATAELAQTIFVAGWVFT